MGAPLERCNISRRKNIYLGGPDGFNYYWHDLKKSENFSNKCNFGAGSLMVWAAFNFYKRTPINKIFVGMNSEDYILYMFLLDEVLFDFLDSSSILTLLFNRIMLSYMFLESVVSSEAGDRSIEIAITVPRSESY